MAIKKEQVEQIKLFDWIRHNGLDDISFHVGNERRCTPQQGALLKRLGVKAGVSDVFILRPSRGFHGLIIELKVKGGKLSPSQSEFLATMNREGYLALARFGADEAIKTIKEYLQIV